MTTSQELPSDPDFARQIEQCETDAWLNLDQSVANARQFEFQSFDGATLLLDRATDWPHSRILSLGVARPATTETIEKVLESIQEAGITTLTAEVSPIARPGTLSRTLTQAGFQQEDRNVIVARNTAAMSEPDEYFRIRSAEAGEATAINMFMQEVMPFAPDWCTLLAGQVSRPNWRYYLAIEDGAICGLASIHLDSEIAWLSPVWVKAAYRNRGTQAALIAHSVREAAANDAVWIASSYPAEKPGRTRNFDRAGFSIVYLRNRFVWRATDS